MLRQTGGVAVRFGRREAGASAPQGVVSAFHPVQRRIDAVDGTGPIELRQRTFAIRLWTVSLDLAQEDGEHLHRGKDTGRVVVLHWATILLIGDITPIVILCLNGPVAPKGLK